MLHLLHFLFLYNSLCSNKNLMKIFILFLIILCASIENLIMTISLGAACTSSQIAAVVTREYNNYAEEESFKIYKGSSSSGTLILSKSGSSSYSNKQYTYNICIEPDQAYFIQYSASYGWNGNSNLRVSVGSNVIYQGHLSSGSSGSDTFIYHPCSSSEILVTIARQYGSINAMSESFSIYKGDTTTGSLVFSKQGSDAYLYGYYSYAICIEPEVQYSIAYASTSSNQWDMDLSGFSYVTIEYGTVLLLSGRLEANESSVETFSYPLICQPEELEGSFIRQYGSLNANQESIRLY